MRGGKRKNAGRPKGDPTVTISFRVQVKHEHEAKEMIKAYKQKLKDEKASR